MTQETVRGIQAAFKGLWERGTTVSAHRGEGTGARRTNARKDVSEDQ